MRSMHFHWDVLINTIQELLILIYWQKVLMSG